MALPSSPPIPGEDPEEVMGNLGLEDMEEAEDLSLAMPEDVPTPSPISEHVLNRSKRKIDEVADSEDEDDLGAAITEARLPPTSSKPKHDGFLPSSQLAQNETGQDPARTRSHNVAGEDNSHEDDSEMLLRH